MKIYCHSSCKSRLLLYSTYYVQDTGSAEMVQPLALLLRATLCLGTSAYWLPSSSHIAGSPPPPGPGPPCTPELTVLSTQATERPAKRLATPRATLTSSLRMSSHLLLRNLNNLSVYVATPGEREEREVGGPGPSYVSEYLPQGWGH